MRILFLIGPLLLGAPVLAQDKKPNPLDKKARETADPLLGRFKGAEMSVQIESAGAGKYRGLIALGGKSYPFTAEKDGPGISGTFTAEGEKFPFLAKLEGKALQLKSGDTVYVLLPDAPPPAPKPVNPLDKKSTGGDGKTADPKDAPGNVDPAWKILRHPVGLSLRYPKDWTVKEAQGAYVFVPGDAGQDEAYILSGLPADGIQAATDPRVAQAAEALMAQLAPALKRTGPVEELSANGVPAIALAWEGGPNGRAKMFVIILKDHAIALTGLGAKEKVAAREPVLKRLFTSFAQNEGQRDPKLVGVWHKSGTTDWAVRDSSDRLQVSAAGEHKRALLLRPDGTCISREVDRTIAIGQGVSIDTGDQVTTKNGKWFAGDGKIVLMWEKDAEEYEYQILEGGVGRRLVFGLANGKGLVWQPGQ